MRALGDLPTDRHGDSRPWARRVHRMLLKEGRMKRMKIWGVLLALSASAPALAEQAAHEEKEAAARDMTGKLERRMEHCPSAVPGSVTKIADRKDGVELTVTALDKTKQEEIRRRAHRQESISIQSARGAIEHTGEGTGSGQFGYCPGMIEGTHVTAMDVPEGARLTVQSAQPSQVKKLQRITKERAEALRVLR